MRKSQTISVPSLPDLMRRGCEAAYAKCGFGKLGGGLVEYAFKHTDPADDRFSPQVNTIMEFIRGPKRPEIIISAIKSLDDPNAILVLYQEGGLDNYMQTVVSQLKTLFNQGKLNAHEDLLLILANSKTLNQVEFCDVIRKITNPHRLCNIITTYSSERIAIAKRLTELPNAWGDQDALLFIVQYADKIRDPDNRRTAFEKLSPDSLVRLAISSDTADIFIAAVEKIGVDVERLVKISKEYSGSLPCDAIKELIANILCDQADRIEDPDTLELIVRYGSKDSFQFARAQLIEKIDNDAVLCELIFESRHRTIHNAALQRLENLYPHGQVNDENALVSLILFSENDVLVDLAYGRILDKPKALLKIARRGGIKYSQNANETLSSMVHAEIFDFTLFPEMLEFVATESIDADARKRAISILLDRPIFNTENELDDSISRILDATTDIMILQFCCIYLESKLDSGDISFSGAEAFATRTHNVEKGKQAVDIIESSHNFRLADIAKSATNGQVAIYAATKLFESERSNKPDWPMELKLVELYHDSDWADVRNMTLSHLGKIVDCLNQELTLLIVATDSPDPSLSTNAIEKLSNLIRDRGDVLSEPAYVLIALQFWSESRARQAVRLIHEPDLLIKVAKETHYQSVACEALDHLSIQNPDVGELLNGFLNFDHSNKSNDVIMDKAREIRRNWESHNGLQS
ncbi:hypothetical protein KKF81_02750 [Candidatus Micrarchaeota archaeon]|nr:hypothetical protein [Candidatus Micrarchaeota archaeon]MBU1165841.1 hypothetical protein [Candidatus Micrarchaeota archaeon]MBU1886476.1 hypothetical protein [Candidatus Micrarchaeota archaeon]